MRVFSKWTVELIFYLFIDIDVRLLQQNYEIFTDINIIMMELAPIDMKLSLPASNNKTYLERLRTFNRKYHEKMPKLKFKLNYWL